MRLVCISAFAVFTCLLSLCSSTSAQNYTFETVAVPNATETFLSDINNNGIAVGSFGEFPGVPFRYEMGEYQELQFPSVPEADVIGINDAGAVVGLGFDEEEFLFLAFVADPAGNVELLEVPGAFWTFPFSIDEANVVTGVTLGFEDSTVIRKDGDAIEEISIEGIGEAFFAAANDNGTIVGAGALEDDTLVSFVYRDGVTEPLVHPDGETQLAAINNAETIAGQIYIDELTSRSFVYADESFTEVAFPGAASTNVSGINDAGVLVGFYRLPDSEFFQGFIATPVPEPSSATLGWFALLAVGRLMRRQRS